MARRRSGKKIDFVHWTLSNTAVSLGAGTSAVTMLAAQHLSETLLRIRGSLTAHIEGVLTPNVGANIGVGVILVPEGTGSTVTWSPPSAPPA